jgi:phosphoribosylamine---glycine ligase
LYLFKGIRMKILVVGSGGREHALAWALAKSPNTEVFALPGNPGIASVAQCLPAFDLSPRSILAAAQSLNVDLTVIGPEAPLVAGVVDHFNADHRPIVGPTANHAQLEGSKVYAKKFFRDHRIPTAEFETVDNPLDARRAVDRFRFPVVIKTDGLAAGKGVVIAQDLSEAEDAIQTLGPRLVIEEFLTGPEVSFIALSDGKDVVPLIPARDHKRIFDGDLGPNTGGMGAFCDPSLLTPLETAQILETIIWPTVEATRFTGFLYAGLMMTPKGPKLLEYNVRLGDPETQPLMHHLNMDFAEVLMATAQGKLGTRALTWNPGCSAAVVLATEGYPGNSRLGDLIVGIDRAKAMGVEVFQAGTKVGWGGLRTAGGRVLAVTASGPTLDQALTKTYAAVDKIHFRGMQFRRDIGQKSPNQLS